MAAKTGAARFIVVSYDPSDDELQYIEFMADMNAV